ncbi:SCO2583 family membrane protein [Streptomyces yaizuensis]|uniref:Membrane protein n=1 Tax=Streptomyces yaizuensis TaxID=2989713 RepID=A0ABQ5NUB8_9ACTN|nr:hypothetical protein [Streptomyces sp. YSPA8]GLF93743.1 membrane protein [Streptomyces sp. YSPA8]
MAGRRDPPEGTPDGLPDGGEDEYRSVVFDESFVRAARLQEYSALERLDGHTRAVRSLPSRTPRSGSLPTVFIIGMLSLLIALVFGTAIYLGVRPSFQAKQATRPAPLRITVIPLAPQGPVPGGAPADLFARSPAAHFRTGAAGIVLPGVRRTEHFSTDQVVAALTTVKDYLVESSLNPEVLTGSAVRPVRLLLDPDQHQQFDRSMATPAPDGRHAATGWLVRYDPARVALADPAVRVRGTLTVTEAASGTLEITSDHTFVYALRPATGRPGGTSRDDDSDQEDAHRRDDPAAPAAGTGPYTSAFGATGTPRRTTGPLGAPADASLFTVRRELHFRFDREDLDRHRAELVAGRVQAGPHSCATDASGALRPLLAGQQATTGLPAATDPYAPDGHPAALCGSLDPAAQPTPQDPGPAHS